MKKKTTKVCPNCGNTHLARLATLNKKYCVDCNTSIAWYLEEGQAGIFGGCVTKPKEEVDASH